MKTIYIYPKVAIGFRGATMGLDREGLSLKKRSTRLKNNIKKLLVENNMNSFRVEVAHGFETPEELLGNDGVLVLISPYIKHALGHLDFSNRGYYFLSEEEYSSENMDHILMYIKSL